MVNMKITENHIYSMRMNLCLFFVVNEMRCNINSFRFSLVLISLSLMVCLPTIWTPSLAHRIINIEWDLMKSNEIEVGTAIEFIVIFHQRKYFRIERMKFGLQTGLHAPAVNKYLFDFFYSLHRFGIAVLCRPTLSGDCTNKTATNCLWRDYFHL